MYRVKVHHVDPLTERKSSNGNQVISRISPWERNYTGKYDKVSIQALYPIFLYDDLNIKT